MKCPTCPDTVLLLSERQGIEIDYCPQCRGIWLDRGKLERLTERTAPRQDHEDRPQGYQGGGHHGGGGGHGGRRWLDRFFR